MVEFVMPSLGADMEAGTLVEWLRKPGDAVRRGDIVAVVETQKGAIEVEIFDDGTIDRILVSPGTRVPVGTPLALIASAGAAPGPTVPAAREPAPAPPSQPVQPPPAPVVPSTARRRASPAARRRAGERGIDLSRLIGTGPDGAILFRDVEQTAIAPPPTGARGLLDLAEMRKAIAAAMARSKREIPHYYLSHTIEVERTLAWLEARNAQRPPPERLLPAALWLKAVALALREMTEFNGAYGADGFAPSAAIHVGAAIAIRGGGLIAPAILDTDSLSLDELMAALRDLVARVRAGRLRASELSRPTITVTSLGERGVDGVFGAIYPPQVAIVGIGRIAVRPWVVDGRIEPRRVVTMSLAADHRVSDGHRGALFLGEIERRLGAPEQL